MKLMIGENIRAYRKKHDLTQEELAERLGVTYQSVSRWENGATYPDLELLPAIAQALSVTADELLGMPEVEKEKRATETLDELRRECVKPDYDADRIVALLRDIRRNYLRCNDTWRPWSEGNTRAFGDPRILPEVRLLANAYLELYPMSENVIVTMSLIEDEEHLQDFLDTHTTAFDCSARALLFNRYFWRGDMERFEPERMYQLQQAMAKLLNDDRNLLPRNATPVDQDAAAWYRESLLTVFRRDAADDGPDMWTDHRLDLAISLAQRALRLGDTEEAMRRLEGAVRLLENTMRITEEVPIPTSCRFLDGIDWRAREDWQNIDNHPDSPLERIIFFFLLMGSLCTCHCIFPSKIYAELTGEAFAPLRERTEYASLCARVQALIVMKPAKNAKKP